MSEKENKNRFIMTDEDLKILRKSIEQVKKLDIFEKRKNKKIITEQNDKAA